MFTRILSMLLSLCTHSLRVIDTGCECATACDCGCDFLRSDRRHLGLFETKISKKKGRNLAISALQVSSLAAATGFVTEMAQTSDQRFR